VCATAYSCSTVWLSMARTRGCGGGTNRGTQVTEHATLPGTGQQGAAECPAAQGSEPRRKRLKPDLPARPGGERIGDGPHRAACRRGQRPMRASRSPQRRWPSVPRRGAALAQGRHGAYIALTLTCQCRTDERSTGLTICSRSPHPLDRPGIEVAAGLPRGRASQPPSDQIKGIGMLPRSWVLL